MAIPMRSPNSSRPCVPRFATPRNPDRETFGGEIARIAEALGQPLMPWQRLVADVGGELDADGLPVYREIVCTVPRQSGKTTLMLAWEAHRALMWGSPQRIAYTAQTGQDARMKLIEDQYDGLIALSPLSASIRQAKRAMGATALVFKNGSRIDALATSSEAGHGKTLGLAVIDEAMADEDDRREQAFIPTMSTVPDAQVLIFSTAGTEASVFLNRKIDQGRAALTDGVESRTAYFEWSADDDTDPDDEDAWWGFMPALGHTIGVEAVRHARRSMTDGEFRRAYLNQRMIADERVIPPGKWQDARTEVGPSGKLTFAVDATPDRKAAAVAVCDESGTVEVIDHQAGIGWLVDRLVALYARHQAPVVVDQGGPLGYLVSELEGRDIPVVKFGASDYANACAVFFDGLMDGKVKVFPHPGLESAVPAARKRKMGDRWLWARQDIDSDISPLVAVTLAFGAGSVHSRPDAGLVFAVLD